MNIEFVTNKSDLLNLFASIGLSKGQDVMIHSSMSSLGFVVNGALDVIDSLIESIDINHDTILMPAHTGQLTDPIDWSNPSIPKEFISKVRGSMNLFDKKLTPIRGRGIISEAFLSYPGVERSEHPLNSVSAIGARAKFYTSNHNFDEPEGIDSPVGKLYDNDGSIISIGVGLDKISAIHLAEYIADVDYLYIDNPVVLTKNINGENCFRRIKKYPGSSDNFIKILPILKDMKIIKEVVFNNATISYFKLKPVIDCAVRLLEKNPYFFRSELK